MHPKDKKPALMFMSISAFFIIIIAVFLFVRNIKLRKNKDHIETSLILNIKQRKKYYRKNFPDVNIVMNSGNGLWVKTGAGKATITRELIIGSDAEDAPEEYIIHRANPIKADRDGNIYTGFYQDGAIRKYDQNGRYLLTISRQGQGPGELSGFFRFVIDEDNVLHILSPASKRISQFKSDGTFIKSMNLTGINMSTYNANIYKDNTDHYYLSFFHNASEKVLHVFNSLGEFQYSFGEPILMKDTNGEPVNTKTYASWSIKKKGSRGHIATYNGNILYSQYNPYDLKIYDMERNLKTIILRKSKFNPPRTVELGPNNMISYNPCPSSTYIGIYKNKIINCVQNPGPYGPILCAIDVFNLTGELLYSIHLNDLVQITDMDEQGRLYGFIHDGISQKLVRYKLTIQ
jgi:hypothetical protein